MRQVHDAAIIGAGIAGSTLAKSLADLGWSTIIMERRTFPRHKVCGEFLSPESIDMLSALGIDEAIMSIEPSMIDYTKIIFPDGESLRIPLPGTALGISRYTLDTALIAAAERSGVHVLIGSKVSTITYSNNCFLIEAKQGDEQFKVQARIVIAAWGAVGGAGITCRSMEQIVPSDYSSYLKAIKYSSRQKRNREQAYVGVKAHYEGVDLQSEVELYFFPGGYLGISPIEDGKVNVAALIKQQAFAIKPKTISEWLEAACSSNDKLQKKLANAQFIQGTEAAVAPVHLSRKPQPWNIFPTVGDAAFVIPPLCGDGMSMALRSAELCAPLADLYLKGELTMLQWRKKYTRAIRKQFTAPRRWGRFMQWLLGMPRITKAVLPLVRCMPILAHKLVRATRLK